MKETIDDFIELVLAIVIVAIIMMAFSYISFLFT